MLNINELNTLITHLKFNLIPFKGISRFSTEKGIYAIGFDGIEFPLASAIHKIKPNDIIYIGKAEDSQRERDANSHFKSDQTGHSTVRRSLGAILRKKLGFMPVPRSFTETSNKRFVNYKYSLEGENKLTEWMIDNLSLSYWEWNDSIENLRKAEKQVIRFFTPILNLANNPNNDWRSEIQDLRAECADLAKQYKPR
ncbi:MAG: hypothetical protein L6461_05815 [Anaerolineae bacterium]|nr:hypothetical protein [Anaerolineae bacterium]